MLCPGGQGQASMDGLLPPVWPGYVDVKYAPLNAGARSQAKIPPRDIN